EIFSVKVDKVNTLNRKGKRRRSRKTGVYSQLPSVKHAMVTLKEGTIELFQQQR
ncbi:MAG: 50S ribosomal protein L23, partial [Actinomycetota bacterium]|nr:50S ribosomal protein L23 [Actinomycetota bacterium]